LETPRWHEQLGGGEDRELRPAARTLDSDFRRCGNGGQSIFLWPLEKFIWLAAGKSVKSAGTQPPARSGIG
jgi:hypothetical protein